MKKCLYLYTLIKKNMIMHKKKIFILIAIIVSLLTESRAQELQASLKHYSTEDGLVSNAISHITQDKYGFIWIATWNGMARFDGYKFHNYQLGPMSGIPMLHNRVIDLTADHSQNIWMRMYDGRVFMLERTTDKIINPFEGMPGYERFLTRIPLTLTSDGHILALINNTGIYKLKYEKEGKIKKHLITTNSRNISTMTEGYKGDVWLGTDNGIFRLPSGSESIANDTILAGEKILCMFSNGFHVYTGTQSGKIIKFAYGQEPETLGNAGNAISSVFVDSHGIIWFTTSKIGISKLDPQTKQMKDYSQDIIVPEYDVNGAFASEVNGTVWINMNHGGFGYYNREQDRFEYFHNNPAHKWDLSNTVTTYLALPEGVVFESTSRNGLERLMLQNKNIVRTLLTETPAEMDENEVRAIYYDEQRKYMLMGNKRGHLYRFDNGRQTLLDNDGEGKKIDFGRIYGIQKDRTGNYWISTKGNGLFHMKMHSNGQHSFNRFTHNENDSTSLSSDNIYATVEDKHGNIWVATYGGGVNLITSTNDGGYKLHNSNNTLKNFPKNTYLKIRDIATDKEGNVWAGTTDGLIIMSYKDGKISHKVIEQHPDPKYRMQCNDVVSLGCHPDGTMWIGTNGGGLSHCLGKDENGHYMFDNIGCKDGLPSEEIKGLAFDQDGNIWLSTYHTICSVEPQKRIVTIYSYEDGVDDTMFSEDAAVVLPDGNILFGTLDGWYTVDRKKLVNHSGKTIKLRFTEFYIDNVMMSPRLNNTYSYYVPDSKKVTLPKHNSTFAMSFASLNYNMQGRVHYQYMLEGYDEEWQNADKTLTAEYTQIPSGTYTFKVKAFNLESPDAEEMCTIEITVPSHFLLSTAALWIYLAVAVVIAAILIVAIMRKKRKKLAE